MTLGNLMIIDVSVEHIVSSFRIEVKAMEADSSEALVTSYQTTYFLSMSVTLQCHQYLDYIAWNGMMTDELESFLEADGCILIEYYPSNFPEELKKSTKNLNQCSRCFERDSNRPPPEYECRALPMLTHLVSR
jgi:hypothetical protein